MCKAGSYDPVAVLEIYALDRFDAERSPSYGTPIVDFIGKSLGFKDERYVYIWNDLPANIRGPASQVTFRKHLKTLLFKRSYN